LRLVAEPFSATDNSFFLLQFVTVYSQNNSIRNEGKKEEKRKRKRKNVEKLPRERKRSEQKKSSIPLLFPSQSSLAL